MSASNTYIFRWTGKHIDKMPQRANVAAHKLTKVVRDRYIGMLAEALDSKMGLFAQAPKNDILGNGFFETTRPCLCFTELSIQNVAEHCRKYGRLGFGFTKQFIAKHGGGPVHYTLGTESDPTIKSLKRLASLLNGCPLKPAECADLDYIMHFFKRLKDTKAPAKSKDAKGESEGQKKRSTKSSENAKNNRETKLARYPTLKDLEYLEENEWRLVYTKANKKWHSFDEKEERAEARFSIEPGKELQAVVLPDNLTVQQVLQKSSLTEKLFQPGRPPVQLISLESLLRLP